MISADRTAFEDRQILTTTFEQNWYWGFPSLFSSDQVDTIRKICDEAEQEEAGVAGLDANHEVRKNRVSWHDHQALYELLKPALMLANQRSGWNYDITAIEPMQYTVYHGDNDHFTWHTDTIINDDQLHAGASGPLQGTIRKISCTIQLSDGSDYEGGDFELLSGTSHGEPSREQPLRLAPLSMGAFRGKGAAVFFPSFTYHRVKPVTSGVRRSLVCWFRGPKWR